MNFTDGFYESILKNKCFSIKHQSERFIQRLYDALFLINEKENVDVHVLKKEFFELEAELKNIFSKIMLDESADTAETIVYNFIQRIPDIYATLKEDAQFIANSDPAATSAREVEVSYPGFFAIAIYRFAHVMYIYKVPVLARIFSEYAHGKTGIDIHPGAKIASPFMIDHGTGIVVGETTIIGKRVKLFQGVTLGALSVTRDKKNTIRHPSIEDDVVIYSGSTILGGNTVIGKGSIIGGNVWLVESVEPFSKVFNKSQTIIKEQDS